MIVLARRGVNAGGNGNFNTGVLLFLRKGLHVSVCDGAAAAAAAVQDFNDDNGNAKSNSIDKDGLNSSRRTQLSAHTAHSGEKWCLLHCLFLQCGCDDESRGGARNGLRQIRHAPRSSKATAIASKTTLMTRKKQRRLQAGAGTDLVHAHVVMGTCRKHVSVRRSVTRR